MNGLRKAIFISRLILYGMKKGEGYSREESLWGIQFEHITKFSDVSSDNISK